MKEPLPASSNRFFNLSAGKSVAEASNNCTETTHLLTNGLWYMVFSHNSDNFVAISIQIKKQICREKGRNIANISKV